MALDQTTQTDPRLAFAATLPLTALPRFSCMELLVTLCAMLEGTGVVATLDSELSKFDEIPEAARFWNRQKAPPRVGLTVNGVTILVEGRDRAGFSPAELGRLDFRSWPDGDGRVSRARAHVAITEICTTGGDDLDHNYDRAAAVTIVAAAVARLTEAAAVVWHTSLCAVPAAQLPPLVAALAQGQAPVPLWFGCPGRPEGASGAATRGLYPLLGAEIEIASPDMPVNTAFALALDLVAEILRAGEAPEHGAWLDYDKNTEFGVRHQARSHAGAVPTVVLIHATRRVAPEATAGAA
jgi:hypothetical protein